MTNLKQRMKDVLEETVAYYSEDTSRRAVGSGNRNGVGKNVCSYLTSDGRMCAVGRCLTEDTLRVVKDKKAVYGVLLESGILEDFKVEFKEKYDGLPALFWQELQFLHDYGGHWNDVAGLSGLGEDRVAIMLRYINNGHYETEE